MPAWYRRRVARLAAAHPDTLFVDDMTLTELPLGDTLPPLPLASFGLEQPNLVSVGSLSKLYWGGLRTGWISASAGLIARVAAAKAAADLGSAAFPQAITAALLGDKHDDIVKWRGEWLRARYDALTEACRGPPCPGGPGLSRTAGSPYGCASPDPKTAQDPVQPTAARSPRPRSGMASPWSPAGC